MYDELTATDATCPECGGENLTDRPICPACWNRIGAEREQMEVQGIMEQFLQFVAASAPDALEYNGLKGRINAFLFYEHGVRGCIS